MTNPLIDVGHKLFSKHEQDLPRAETAFTSGPDLWHSSLWEAVVAAGFHQALIREKDGGFGFSEKDTLNLLGTAATYNTPIPLAEAQLANRLFALCGLPTEDKPTTIASGFTLCRTGTGLRISGSASRVPYARHTQCIAALAEAPDGKPYVIKLTDFTLKEKSLNLAGEARDTISCDTAAIHAQPLPFDEPTLHALCALIRSAAMAGALEAVLERCVHYSNERHQFGRPIGKFQVIQHYLATMASEVAAARMAVNTAAGFLNRDDPLVSTFYLAAAAAKVRSGEASGIVSNLAHQIHGAIGFSWEYPLHPLTRRLWAWRDEYGNESYWSQQIGKVLIKNGPDSLWPTLTHTTEAQP